LLVSNQSISQPDQRERVVTVSDGPPNLQTFHSIPVIRKRYLISPDFK
jgi:hypothetical protein